MRTFDIFLENNRTNPAIENLGKELERSGVPVEVALEGIIENLIANEESAEKRQQLNEILGWLGKQVGKGVQNFKQGYGQGQAQAAGGQDPMQALNQAAQMLQGIIDPQIINQAFQQMAGTMQQGAAQQGVAGQQSGEQAASPIFPPDQPQKPAMDVSKMGAEWKRQQAQKQGAAAAAATQFMSFDPSEGGTIPTFFEWIEGNSLTAQIHNMSLVVMTYGLDAEETCLEYAAEYNPELGQALVEGPFSGKKGFWGNLAGGIGRGMQALGGAGAAGIGGAGGGAMGGATGAARGMWGKGDNGGAMSMPGGAAAGSEMGRGMMGRGMQGMKDAFGNRHNAKLVSAYRKAENSIMNLAQLAAGRKDLGDFADEMRKMVGYIQKRGARLEKAMDKGNVASMPMQGSMATTIPQRNFMP